MSLAQIKRRSKVVKYQGETGETEIVLNALTLISLTTVLERHIENLDAVWAVWERLSAGDLSFSDRDMGRIIGAMLTEFPHLVADIIAVSSLPAEFSHQELNDAVDGARNLDFGTQGEWLYEIYLLTFTEVGGIKKLWGLVAGLLGKRMTQK